MIYEYDFLLQLFSMGIGLGLILGSIAWVVNFAFKSIIQIFKKA